MKAALVQLSVTDDPLANLPVTRSLVREAAAQGAGFVLTPEVTNCLSSDRAHQREVLRHETDDPTLAALRTDSAELGILLLIGSLPFFIGLTVVMPILGHATWHLYRKLVVTEGTPRPIQHIQEKGSRSAVDFPAVLFPWAK